jgi:hypothetical protein
MGEGFFLQLPQAAGNIKVLFVGEVSTGNVTQDIPAGLSVKANEIPVQENWPGKNVGNDGDSIYTWAGSAWDTAIWSYIAGFGCPTVVVLVTMSTARP